MSGSRRNLREPGGGPVTGSTPGGSRGWLLGWGGGFREVVAVVVAPHQTGDTDACSPPA